MAGQLYIGGDGIAFQYWKRQDLTAEHFISNPFGSNRLYKTGDVCRYLPDGNIEFLGRVDHQVKIRGFRIELGEIEAVLSQHGAVDKAVVLAYEDKQNEKYLVAYVIMSEFVSSLELRKFLTIRLPDYMIPVVYIELDALPFTSNGKINRRALPSPNLNQIREESNYVPPRTYTEYELVKIWEFLLQVSPIGVRDNFFDLGGHSLLVMRLLDEIEINFNQKFQFL